MQIGEICEVSKWSLMDTTRKCAISVCRFVELTEQFVESDLCWLLRSSAFRSHQSLPAAVECSCGAVQ